MTRKPPIICLKCGKCCIIYFKGKWKRCPYLMKNNLCSIYEKRLGQSLCSGFRCVKRDKLHFNISGCPYNRKEWKMHPYYINK